MSNQMQLGGFSDDALLHELHEARERRDHAEAEILLRCRERDTSVIMGGGFTATKKIPPPTYEFSENALSAYEAMEQPSMKSAARQIPRPFVSLSRKEETEETPL